MKRSKIIATGKYLPENVVTNHDLSKLMDTNDEWIVERTGIKERRYAGDGTGSATLGFKASEIALQKAGMQAGDLDFIIAATVSPDYYFPGNGCLIGEMLGVPGTGALDVRNQCCGFIYSLSIADAYIRAGVYESILIVGSEVHSGALDMTTEGRDMAVIFGDGAGAVIVKPSENGDEGVLSCHLHADGTYSKELWLESPGSRRTPWITPDILESKQHHPFMNGKQVFKHAVKRFPEVIREALEENSLTVDDISLIIPHQANLRITQMVAKRMGVGMDKIYSNIHKYGNTTAASIPIALDEAIEDGTLNKGDLLILAAFGSGFTWASSAVRW